MALPPFSRRDHPDITRMEKVGDVKGLISLLNNKDFTLQWRAAEALGRVGGNSVETLLVSLRHPDVRIRLGIIEALGDIGKTATLPALISALSGDESNEVRWVAAISLGRIGDPAAIPALIQAMRDPDKYVRYGSALALGQLKWKPAEPEDRVWYLVSMQRWDDIPALPGVPVDPLIRVLHDRDPHIRAQAVEVLGEIHDPRAVSACDLALTDQNSEVRWKATLAFPKCHIPLMHLPRGLSMRKRVRKDPYVACFLNFFFLGLGYNYLGKWWGFLLFQINVTWILIMSNMIFNGSGVPIPYLLSYAVSAVAVVHTWFFVKKMPDL